MSLRALELDKRREVGVIVKERAAAKQFREIFEEDWAKTESRQRRQAEKEQEESTKNEERQEAAACSPRYAFGLFAEKRSEAPEHLHAFAAPKPTSIRPTVLPLRT